jgi:hypothetical protein
VIAVIRVLSKAESILTVLKSTLPAPERILTSPQSMLIALKRILCETQSILIERIRVLKTSESTLRRARRILFARCLVRFEIRRKPSAHSASSVFPAILLRQPNRS